MNDNRSLLII